ncbi:MAG TPA: hypothetical protein VH186_07795 [Chloroflexia bacterium]|nr:hypothetical protein [Chloroflexia bacterium]
MVSLVHHRLGIALWQQRVDGGDGELGALLKLLKQTKLAGRVITLDAGFGVPRKNRTTYRT